MLKIIPNRDKELYEDVKMQLKKMFLKHGKYYCPCSLERNEDTVCMCKSFKEQTQPGECHCGMYEKIDE